MKCQLQSMSGTVLGTHCNMSATVQNKFQVSYPPWNVSYCQQMSGIIPRNVRYIYYSRYRHETVRYWNVRIHDL